MRHPEQHIPEGYRVQVTHLHHGNTSGNQLKKIAKTNAKYVTLARIYYDGIDLQPQREPLAQGIAACSQKDNPSRQLGREIAIGRALKELGI